MGNLRGADLKVLSSLDIKTEIFIGEPGFMISGIVSFPFDFYVLSGGMKFNMMVWYETIGDPTFGGYCSGEVWGSLLGGLASVNVGVEVHYFVNRHHHLQQILFWVHI